MTRYSRGVLVSALLIHLCCGHASYRSTVNARAYIYVVIVINIVVDY